MGVLSFSPWPQNNVVYQQVFGGISESFEPDLNQEILISNSSPECGFDVVNVVSAFSGNLGEIDSSIF